MADTAFAGQRVGLLPTWTAHIVAAVDRIDSWRRGAVALWLEAGGITVESTNEERGDRPWVPQPRSKRQQPSAAVLSH
jgi:hypothetical protein